MTGKPFGECVAIDTNVFLHLRNPQENTNSHINDLLKYLQANKTNLVVDDKRRILNEYNNQIAPMITNADERLDEIYVFALLVVECGSSHYSARYEGQFDGHYRENYN